MSCAELSPGDDGRETVREETVPVTGNKLPDLALDAICKYLPFEDVLTCGGVCRRWRDYVRGCPRWRSFALGREAYRHGPLPQFAQASLSKISDVTLTAAVPLFAKLLVDVEAETCFDDQYLPQIGEAMVQNICDMPMKFLGDVLRNCPSLESLDMSPMRLDGIRYGALEDLWLDDTIGENRLKRLLFPRKRALTFDHLEAVFQKHPHLEHLAFSVAKTDLVMFGLDDDDDYDVVDDDHSREVQPSEGDDHDDCDDLSEELCGKNNSLKSLQLDLDGLKSGKGAFGLDMLRSCRQLKTLVITRSYDLCPLIERMEREVVYHLTGAGILENLVHLRFGMMPTFRDVRAILLQCRNMETLKIGRVRSLRAIRPEPDLRTIWKLKSRENVAPRLRSVIFSLEPSELRTETWRGLASLMEFLFSCENLTDLSVVIEHLDPNDNPWLLRYRNHKCLPSTSSVSLLQELLGEMPSVYFSQPPPPRWASKITAFTVCLSSWKDWRILKGELPELHRLETLHLNFGVSEGDEADEEVATDPTIPRSIRSLHLWISSRQVGAILRRVLNHFDSITNLFIRCSKNRTGRDEVVALQFYDYMEMTRSRGRLESVEIELHHPIDFGHPPSTNADHLRHVKSIILPSVVFGKGQLEALVSACPLIEVFKVGFDDYGSRRTRGLSMADLQSISAWKYLRNCHLLIDVDKSELARAPPKLSYRFFDMFLEIKDKRWMRQLMSHWKDLIHLEQIEVVGRVKGMSVVRPVIFATRCGCGYLHFDCVECD